MNDIGLIPGGGCPQPSGPRERLSVVTKDMFALGLKLLCKKIKDNIADQISTVNQRVDTVDTGVFVYGTTTATSFTAESTSRVIGLTPTNGKTTDVVGGIYTAKSAGLYYISIDAKSAAVEAAIPEITVSLMVGDTAEATTTLTDTTNIPGISGIVPVAENATVKFVVTTPEAFDYPAGIKWTIIRVTNG